MSETSNTIVPVVKGIAPGAEGTDLQIKSAKIVGKRSPGNASEFVKNGKPPILANATNKGRGFATIRLTEREVAIPKGDSKTTVASTPGAASKAVSSGGKTGGDSWA